MWRSWRVAAWRTRASDMHAMAHRARVILPRCLETPRGEPPCVVHLVRAPHGLAPLQAFAASLREHPPGIEYELVLAMKGFQSRREARPYLNEIADLNPQVLYFADVGLDLGVYFASASALRRERYCFLNSHCTPLVDLWLAKMAAAPAPVPARHLRAP